MNITTTLKYQILGKLKEDCEYFLGFGFASVNHLYNKNINEHVEYMFKIYNSFKEDELPQWITKEQIKVYQEKMNKKGLTNNEIVEILNTLSDSDFYDICNKWINFKN